MEFFHFWVVGRSPKPASISPSSRLIFLFAKFGAHGILVLAWSPQFFVSWFFRKGARLLACRRALQLGDRFCKSRVESKMNRVKLLTFWHEKYVCSVQKMPVFLALFHFAVQVLELFFGLSPLARRFRTMRDFMNIFHSFSQSWCSLELDPTLRTHPPVQNMGPQLHDSSWILHNFTRFILDFTRFILDFTYFNFFLTEFILSLTRFLHDSSWVLHGSCMRRSKGDRSRLGVRNPPDRCHSIVVRWSNRVQMGL